MLGRYKCLRMVHKVYKKLIFLGVVAALVFNPGVSKAKGGDDQTQIILLNDSAAALEDSNPGLSKSLAKFADEKQKEWEHKSTDKNPPPLQEQIKLLKEAALAIQPTYPLIAKSLLKMAKDINHND